MTEHPIGAADTTIRAGEAASVTPAQNVAGAVLVDPIEALVLDLLEWIGPESRAYEETMEAWRTSCPRLPVWEEANARGYIELGRRQGGGSVVSVSARGAEALRAAGRKAGGAG